MGRILAISSHVLRGHVGLAATVPALQSLGHEVWALPTILLASRPGMGALVKRDLPAADLTALLTALESDGCWSLLDAIFTGYFPTPQSVRAVATAIAHMRRERPNIPVCVDPIIGDDGRLYVTSETAAAIRDELLPLASVATPNLFELGWLTSAGSLEFRDVAAAARRLGPPTVVVTSAMLAADRITTLLVAAQSTEHETPRYAGIPNGAGDLFAGLILGHMLNGQSPSTAIDRALADLDKVLRASAHKPVLDLSVLRADVQ